MKKLKYLLFLLAATTGFSQIAYDLRLLQVNSGGTAYTEVLLPGAASITDMASFRTFIGLGGLDNPAHSTLNLVGANSLALGTGSTNFGSINFKNGTNNNTVTIISGVTGVTYTMTLPTATAGGDNYLLNMDADGTMDWTNPASLGGGSVEGTAVLSTGEVGGIKFLREDGDGTSSWQTIPGGGDALTSSPLNQFAATTSLQFKGVISDETGSGAVVFAESPTLVTPALGTIASGVGTALTALNGENIQDDTIDDDSIDFTDVTFDDFSGRIIGASYRLTAAPMGALVIDVTSMKNTKTIAADTTGVTLSATPTTGDVFGITIKNSDTSDHTFTFPTGTWYSEAYNGSRSSITIPASGQVTMSVWYDGSQYNIYGDPVDFFADITEDLTPTDTSVDSFAYYDSATKAVKRMTLDNLADIPIIAAAGFDGNLATTDDTLQEIAQKLDDLVASGFDSTTVNATTWGDGLNASNVWTFNVSGTDPTMTWGSASAVFSGDFQAASFVLPEVASVTSPGAGFGRYWVINNSPSRPRFTDDTGNSHAIIHGNVAAQDEVVIGGSGGGGYVTKSAAKFSTGGTLTIPAGQTIQLGDASDTTIARSAAGRITVEGVEVSMTGENVMTPKSTATTYTIGTTDPLELKGGYIIVTAATTITVPTTITTGMNWSVKANVAGAVVVNPDDTHTITLDGVALSAGDSITSTSTLGDLAVFVVTSSTTIDVTTNGWTDTN